MDPVTVAKADPHENRIQINDIGIIKPLQSALRDCQTAKFEKKCVNSPSLWTGCNDFQLFQAISMRTEPNLVV